MQLVPGPYLEKLVPEGTHLLLGFMPVIPDDATRRGKAKLSLGSGNQDHILGVFLGGVKASFILETREPSRSR